MDKLKETFSYALGFVLFVVLIPVIMWLCSKMPALKMPQPFLLGIAIFCIIDGLFLSIWAIVYMRRVGDGNPMDAFGHEVAPRTKHLMTDGPYRLSRNPMLTGIFVYLIGCCLWLWTWQSVVVFLVFVAIMLVQVRTEEDRLRRDFGEEYEKYCNQTGRFSPKIRKNS
ncbi:MAG: isoprenylcysteine carboxylmethyltransferase family protein [Bacteroidales bacterium]|nr:isoprenylcysteine carboxylmethyltransferase family protein [Bacteroidales bacterium]